MRAKKQVVTNGYSLADYFRQTFKKYETAGRIAFEYHIQLFTWDPDQLCWRRAYRGCRVDMVVNQTGPAECLARVFYHMGHVAVVSDGQINASFYKDV